MSAWEDFLDEVEEKKGELKFEEGEETFYRGHGDIRWSLLPTVLRHQKDRNLSKRAIRRVEMNLFFEFRARARELHQYRLSDWEVLQFMRHHGVATRLLDWTEVFGVALHFAISTRPTGATPCIWILNPFALNEDENSFELRELIAPEYMDDEDSGYELSDYMNDHETEFWWKHPVALYPEQKSARLHAQRGYFTVHGSIHAPLDEIDERVVRCVKIHREAIKDARRFLDLAGINEHLLFPDLDGLARELHRKNNIR